MATTASTTAPATSAQDPAADESDGDLEAFFSSGTGSAMHYDRQDQGGTATSEEAGTSGP